MKKKIKIREGNTGILYIKGENGYEDRFIPDCDLKESNRLLLEFYKLQSSDGKSIKNSFWEDNINWFPTIIALLHWHIMYIYVKYHNLFNKYPVTEYNYVFLNNGRLSDFFNLLLPFEKTRAKAFKINLKYRIIFQMNYLKNIIRYIVAFFYNRRVLRYYPQHSLLFYRCGVTDDFRTKYVIKSLSDMDIKYIELGGLKIKQLILSIFIRKPLPNILMAEMARVKNYKSFSIPEDLDPVLKWVFQSAIFIIQDKIKNFQSTYEFFKKQFKDAPFKVFYGIDDTNAVYPVIYACQANGIKTIGHQHGANYSRWDAPYMLSGFEQGEYQWFDKILVWGEWWKEHILECAPCFSAKGQIAVGTHMRPVLQPKKDVRGKKGTMNILIPYEFLGDTYIIGKYMCALQELGYTIHFKWRKDERLEDELEAYCLPKKNERRLIIVKDINDELMAKIDIVAGSYSTLIFDLLPYMKETWIFETKFVFWDCLVEKGIANKIRLQHLKEDIENSRNRINEKTVDKIFSKESLRNVLKKEVKEALVA